MSRIGLNVNRDVNALPSNGLNQEADNKDISLIRSQTGETRRISPQKTTVSPRTDAQPSVQGKSLLGRQVKPLQDQKQVEQQDRAAAQVRDLMSKAGPLLDKVFEGEWFKTGATTSWRVALVNPENREAAKQALREVFQELADSSKKLTVADFQRAAESFFTKLSEGNLLDTWSIEPESAVVTYQGVEYSAKTVTDLRKAMCQKMFAENASRLMATESLTEQIGTLRMIANYAVSKNGAATGGKGYIGLGSDGVPVKFLTHYGERSAFKDGRLTVTEKDLAFVNQSTESLRNTLLGIAGGVSSAMRDTVDALLKPEEKDGIKLLSREQVVRAIDEISKALQVEKNERFNWKDVRHLGTQTDTTFSGVSARRNSIEARDRYVADFLRKQLNDEKSELGELFANGERGLGAQGPKVKKCLLDMLDSNRFVDGLSFRVPSYFKGPAALHRVLETLLERSESARFKGFWGKAPSEKVNGQEGPTMKEYGEAFAREIRDIVLSIKETLTMAEIHEPGVHMGHDEHPIVGQEAPNLKKGQVFRQGMNTCFMMSVFNSLNSNDEGVEFLKARLFPGNGDALNMEKPEDGFSQLEHALFDIYEPDGFGIDAKENEVTHELELKLGQMGTAQIFAEALGLKAVGSEVFFDKTPQFQRRMIFAKAVEMVKNNPCNILIYGKHYVAVTGVYSDEKDFGFWVSDSLSGTDYKFSLNEGGTPGQFFTFEKPAPENVRIVE